MNKKTYTGIVITTLLVLGGIGVISTSDHRDTVFAKSYQIQQSTVDENNKVTKEDIQYKMLNSIKYYVKAKGSFINEIKPLNEVVQVDYNVKVKNGTYSKVKVVEKNGGKSSLYESAYSGVDKSLTHIFPNQKKYKEMEMEGYPEDGHIAKNNSEKKSEIAKRYSKTDKGEKQYKYLPDPSYMGFASKSLFSQLIATGYLEDYSNWDIVSDNQKLLGLNVVVIEGKFNQYYQEKHKATTFKLWVHRDTGILLQMEEYDANGNTVQSLKTTDIKINDKDTNNNYKFDIPSTFKKMDK